ncbi:MAG: N-acetylglucosamine-6-phosphate deacetylase [Chloroflexi bacterium]|nr:N-acetylglucosamine-6-phosphate deacetylase [Chloroflexota bacterium]
MTSALLLEPAGSLLLINALLYTPSFAGEEGWVLTHRGHIAAVGQGTPPQADAKTIDLRGLILAPGLIDLHAHGALGRDTMDADPAALREMAAFYARHGVTAFLATTMTAPQGEILAALAAIRQVMAEGSGGAALIGAHVEGPYLDAERSGAQDARLVRRALPTEYEPLLGTGAIRLITLAPEYPENRRLLRDALAYSADGARIAVAAGHTRASYEQMVEAAGLGLSQVTHLYNGMEPMHHRRPGAVGAALTLDTLRCQLIADNIHVHPAMLKLAVRAKGPDGIMLVSDAMSGTGMPDGIYILGGLEVIVRGGEARLPDGTLAGSTLTLERAVANIVAAASVSLADALTMASQTPARALGLDGHKGAIAPGMDADLIVLDADLRVRLSVVEGRIAHNEL